MLYQQPEINLWSPLLKILAVGALHDVPWYMITIQIFKGESFTVALQCNDSNLFLLFCIQQNLMGLSARGNTATVLNSWLRAIYESVP